MGSEEDSKNLHYLQLWEVTLDVAGASVKLSPLLVSQNVGNWQLYKCWNCECFTHFVKKSTPSKILVTNRMEYNVEKIREMEGLKSFSPIFKIIMRENRDREEDSSQTQFRKRVSSLNYGRDDPTLKGIHDDMKSFLQEEQDSMEDRIKKFEEGQRMVYAELQARAHRERSIIFRLITSARESAVHEAVISPTPTPSFTSSNLPPRAHLDKPEPPSSRTREVNKPETAQQRNNLVAPAKEVVKKAPEQSHQRLLDDDDVFGTMDGFDNDEDLTSFSQSDDDSAFTDDSFRDDIVDESNGTPKAVAQSAPISMPMFRKSPKKSTSEQDEDRPPISYEKMAASIQALALSCHDTGMFGELPKPRLNSIPWRL